MALSRRKVLYMAVCATCHEAGFLSAEEAVIETLTVMLQSLICEIARTSQMFAEHNGRCEVIPNDVFIALIEMGLNVESILNFANNRNVIFRIPTPGREPPQKQPTILHIDQTRPLHSYIPNHFPPFPDAHSYIRTPTQRQPITEYEAIRDKAASQKRDLEKALTRYVARTCDSNPDHSLFANNASLNKIFPLISIKPSNLPFLDALLPKDQIFNDDEDEDEEDTVGNGVANARSTSVIVKGSVQNVEAKTRT
uniref:Transcription initiation factor TFIID subunit 8 n=1 Tax=Aceria tosichella TaxID=561515 RepID=A0A6G1SKN9_9ACAR